MTAKETAKLYLGVDVGGTKILAALADPQGGIVARERCATPRDASAEDTLAAIIDAMARALDAGQAGLDDLAGIGLAIPGVVDPDKGFVVVTPNMNLTGLEVEGPVEERFGVPVALGNDVNLGTLGEKWLGAARYATSAVGIFVGTGIGGGVIVDGKIVRGCREGAGEIGHLVMQLGGPLCGCGNRGCLEALASRTAIERDIRAAIAEGRASAIEEELGDPAAPIKSKALRRALKAEDPVVTEVLRHAAEILGYACLSVRHLLDPDVIVLGGGVIEACGSFVTPIVREIVAADALAGARAGGAIVESELADDAVVLGAVALAQQVSGGRPLEDAADHVPDYPKIKYAGAGEVAVGGKVYTNDIWIRGDGKVKKRNKKLAKEQYGTSHKIGPAELDKLCKGSPQTIVIGMGQNGMAGLTPEGEAYLSTRGIEVVCLPSAKAVKEFNRTKGRKAAIIHVTC